MFTVSNIFLKNYIDIDGYSDSNQANKDEFHKKGKVLLKQIAKELKLSEFDIRSNIAGIAVSGEITLHSPSLYMQINCSFSNHGSRILYRSCNGMTDYCGGPNNYAFFDRLKTHSC